MEGATLILNVEENVRKANQTFREKGFFKELNEDPATKHDNIVNSIIEGFGGRGLLSASAAIRRLGGSNCMFSEAVVQRCSVGAS